MQNMIDDESLLPNVYDNVCRPIGRLVSMNCIRGG